MAVTEERASEQTEPQFSEEELLSYLYPKSFTCIVCDKEFTDFIVRKSKLKVEDMDTDYMTKYKVINPYHYDIVFCSHCGYASLSSFFDKITMRQQQMVREQISVNYKPTEFHMPLSIESVMKRYGQALLCARAIDAKDSQKAFLNLRLSWVLRTAKRKDIELKFLREAYEGLKKAFTTERFPLGGMDEPTAKYMIADMARRLGEMAEAMRWIGDVVVARGIQGALKDRASLLKDMIRDGITT